MTDRAALAKRLYVQAKTLSLGMTAAVFAYGAMAYVLIQAGKGGPALLGPQMYSATMGGMLIFSAVGLWMMFRLRARILNPVPMGTETASAEVSRPPQKLFIATVIMMAAAELPVLFGLILVFLGRNFYVFLPFAGLSCVGFFLAFPRKPQWEDWLGLPF